MRRKVCEWAFGKHVTDVPKALTTKTLKVSSYPSPTQTQP